MGVVDDMKACYAQRAEYYERGYARPERQIDLRAIEAWTRGVFAGRRVLEIACGTCWWTPHAAALAVSWLATDINPETLSVAAAKALPTWVEAFAAVSPWALDAEWIQYEHYWILSYRTHPEAFCRVHQGQCTV